MKRKLMYVVCMLTALLATFIATTTAYASYPFFAHQPKAPKSLIIEDK